MVSICIPTYEMKGRGVKMLNDLLVSIYTQDYKDYEIIVSDNSDNWAIADYLIYHQNIKYLRNDKQDNAASNFNNAIKQATGDIIKPMCQDDYFIQNYALSRVANCEKWVVCSSTDHQPYINIDLKRLIEGENTYGCPSVVAWRKCDILFDENIPSLFDCEFYSRLINLYGQPEIYLDVVVGIRHWDGQMTNEISGNTKILDLQYVRAKYKDLC